MATTIRLATEDDAAQILDIYGPFCRDSHVSFEVEPPSLAEMRRRIAATLPAYPWLVAEDPGQVLGYAYASRHHERAAYMWSVNVSVYIGEGRRRSGLGRALYAALFALLRVQGFHVAKAGATLPNPGSEGLHLAMGFQPVGIYRSIGYKCGAWHDVIWWQLPLLEPRPDPRPPLPLDAIRGTPNWDDALAEATAILSRGRESCPACPP